MTTYDVDYFIAKFEAIPEGAWCVGAFRKGIQCCALGHCGDSEDVETPEEAAALRDVLCWAVARINDGEDYRYEQPTPKQRILAALRDIKAKQDAP